VDGRRIRHEPHVPDRPRLIELLRNARGFVLYSTFENWSLAADEAAACGLPLLLPGQNWSRERFGTTARFFSRRNPRENVEILRAFHTDCPSLPVPPKPKSWREVAEQLKGIYQRLLAERG
jgi:glycosyltransferase involved in cell wall biosynthesis